MKTEILQKLRNGQPLNLFNKSQKQFVKIQLNRAYKRVCWERWVSLDKSNWIKQNAYLSLKDVSSVLNYYKNLNNEAQPI